MTRPQRPCLGPGCGALTRNPGGRCRPCEQAHQKTRNANRPQYAGTWQATSKRARKEQPWCSVCGTTQNLTLDHETLSVQCRACNSAHRGTTVPSRKPGGGPMKPQTTLCHPCARCVSVWCVCVGFLLGCGG